MRYIPHTDDEIHFDEANLRGGVIWVGVDSSGHPPERIRALLSLHGANKLVGAGA